MKLQQYYMQNDITKVKQSKVYNITM